MTTRAWSCAFIIAVVAAIAAPSRADDLGTQEPATGSAGSDAGSSAGSAAAELVPVPPPPPAPEPPPPPRPTYALSGSVQLDYLGVPTADDARAITLDGATAELSLRMTKDFTKNISATAKVCFACHGFEAAMGYVEIRAADELHVRVGRLTPSFGNFPLRHDPANHATSDKPLPYDMGRMLRRNEWDEGILPAPWVDNGIEVGGTHFFRGGQIEYAAFAVSGPKGSPDAADFDFTLSRAPEQYYVDNNSEPALGGRAAVSLDLSDDIAITAGASTMFGHYDPARRLGFVIVGADAMARVGRAYFRAEYLFRRTEMALGDDPALRFKYGPTAGGKFDNFFVKDGFYAEAEVPVGPVSVIARWDGLRRIGNVLATSGLSSSTKVLRYTGGLAIRLAAKVHLKTSVELYQFDDFANEVAFHLGVATPF